MRNLTIVFAVLVFVSIGGCKTGNNKAEKYFWKTFRGVNVGTSLTKQDIADLKEWNVNLIRVSMTPLPFMELEPPYKLNPEAFEYIDQVLDWCEEYDISVLIDPHKFPGTLHPWTMLGNDPFWKDFKYHELAMKMWDAISKRYAERGAVVAGYDLLNEPEIQAQMKKGSPDDINLLYSKLIETIRKNDTKHTISLALPRRFVNAKMEKYHMGINHVDIPSDDNIVLQSHTYMPQKFSHQNVWYDDEFVHYPGEVEGKYWNYKQLVKEQEDLINFSKANTEIPIFIGEFSCPRWTGEDGIRYLTDVIKIAEENNWSWAYHAFRESHIWNAEMSPTLKADSLKILKTTPRLELLKKGFAKNME